MSETHSIDLVLEGGGAKGTALVGAVVELAAHGYRFERIAGTSAGAVVGAIVAAMAQAGEPMSRADDIMRSLDYTKVLDRRRMARWLSWWPSAADAAGIFRYLGAYRGLYLEQWLRGVLGEFGVRTFGDLKFDDPGAAWGHDKSYRLLVSASDLSRQRPFLFPWDLAAVGHDPDDFDVARAVRASSAIPFLFEPVRLSTPYGASVIADGAVLRSYPVDIFDRRDSQPARWPTVGVRLSSPAKEGAKAKPVTGPATLLRQLITTSMDSNQVRHVNDPRDAARSIFIKPKGVKMADFDLTDEQKQSLFEAGVVATRRWLSRQASPEK
jgi:NTE family protein